MPHYRMSIHGDQPILNCMQACGRNATAGLFCLGLFCSGTTASSVQYYVGIVIYSCGNRGTAQAFSDGFWTGQREKQETLPGYEMPSFDPKKQHGNLSFSTYSIFVVPTFSNVMSG